MQNIIMSAVLACWASWQGHIVCPFLHSAICHSRSAIHPSPQGASISGCIVQGALQCVALMTLNGPFALPSCQRLQVQVLARGLIGDDPCCLVQALDPKGCRRVLWCSCMGLLVSAFLPAVPRVIAFVGIGAIMVAAYTHILNTSLLLQCFLYVAGAVSFIR